MSKSDQTGHHIFLFDDWVVDEYRRTGGFTALIVLVATGNLTVSPLRSTFVHVVGDEINWPELSRLLTSAGVSWDGVLLETRCADEGGPVADLDARLELRALEKRIVEDRSSINDGHFFDKWGRRLRVEEAQPQ